MDSSILSKIRHYCAYQERSHQEVRSRLLTLGSRGLELEEIIVYLIENNFLNEERYTQQFVKGKFNLKKWGRVKIKLALKTKGVSSYCINKGLKEISPDDYFETLSQLAHGKINQYSQLHPAVLRKKVFAYLQSKGYESSIINEVLSDVLS